MNNSHFIQLSQFRQEPTSDKTEGSNTALLTGANRENKQYWSRNGSREHQGECRVRDRRQLGLPEVRQEWGGPVGSWRAGNRISQAEGRKVFLNSGIKVLIQLSFC